MATCRVHNNTRGKIYMLCGRRRHRRFPTTLHIIIFNKTYTSIPQKAKPFHTPHFILSQRAIHHFTNYNTKHHSHILFHILCTIKSTLNSYHKYFAFVSNHVTDRSAILFYTPLAASGWTNNKTKRFSIIYYISLIPILLLSRTCGTWLRL